MKKSLFTSLLGMTVLSFVFFSACEIGLGSSVDVEAPKIEFADSTVESGAVVRDAFAVCGKWTDDGSIGSITATLKNLSSGASFKKNGSIKDGNWTVTFSPAEEAIPDGSYELSVAIKDTADHETKVSRAFTIDNTPPLVVLSRPSTKLGATLAGTASFDSYGQKFTLEGKAADDNDVSLIEVNVYENPDCSGSPLKTISLPNVPLTIETDVAEYSSTVPNDYAVIYGHVDTSGIAQRTGGDAFRYCKLVVYDGAQRYPADGSAQTDADKKGNSVDYYYLNSDISSLFTEGYKITELYHILNGTYTGGARTTSPAGVISLLNSASTKVNIGQFKLNPENSPKFVVSAKNTLPVDNNGNINIDFSDSDMPYFITNGNGPLEIEVTPGLDGHLILEETIGVYLLRCDDFGALLDSSGNIVTTEEQAEKIWLIETGAEKHAQQADVSQSGSTYKFKTKSSIGTTGYPSLGINHNYYICVTGYDEPTTPGATVGNKVISEGKYGFRLTNTSQNIDVSTPSQIWYSSNESASNSSKNPSVTLTFSSLDYLPVNLYRGINQNIVGSSSDTPKQENIGDSQITNNQLINSVPASELSTHPQYLYYKVVSTTGTAQSNQKRVEVKYDNTAPTATLPTSGIPNATATEQPTFTIQGTAADNTNDNPASYEQSSGVKEVYIQIWDGNSTTPSTTSTPAYSSSATAANQAIKASYSEGSWIYTIKPSDIDYNGVFDTEGPKTIKVTAVDGVGLTNSNQTPSTDYIKTFQYDKSLPIISFTNTTPAANTYRNSNFTIEVEAADTNDIDTVEILYGSTTDTAAQKAIGKSVSLTSEPSDWATTHSKYYTDAACTIKAGATFTSGTYYTKLFAKSYRVSGTTGSETQLADGTYNFTVRVTDKAGKKNDVTRSFTVDTTSPTGDFAASNPAGSLVGLQRWYKTPSVRFAVAVTETNIDTVTISDGTNSEVMSPSGGNYAASLTELSEGSKTITVTMKDKAGNQNTISETVYVDLTAPALNVTNNLEFMPDAGFTVNGTAEDSGSAVSGIDSLIVKEEHRSYSNGSWSNWTPTTASGTNGVNISVTNGTWSKDLPLGTNVTPQDGEYRYTFTLKDKAGNSTTNSFTTSVDKSAPVITITTPSGKTATNAINSSPYMFSGHIEEANSIAAIYYKYLSSTATAPSAPTSNILTSTSWTNADWTSVNAEENWSFYKEINTSDTTAIPEGIYKLYMYALDGAGNLSERKEELFHVDMADPEVEAAAPDYVNSTTNSNTSNGLRTVTITGTITESHGLQSLYIKRNDESGNGNLVTTTPNGNGTYSFSYTDTPASDGTYTYTITATDTVGKPGNRSKIVVVDTVAEITQVKINNSIVEADANISANWYKAQAIPVNVVVGDSTSGSGVASVEYATLTASEAASATTLGDSNWTQLSLQSSGYGGSAIFSGTGRNQKLYIRVKDNAGNTTYFNTDSTNSSLNEYEKHTPVLINIDTTAPVVGNTFWYKLNENGTAEQSSGQIYVDGTKDLYVYGRSYDTESGLSTTAPLTFTIGENTVTPSEIKYAVTEPGTNQNMTNLTYNNVPSDRRTIKYWKAKFTKDQIDTSAECGTLKVKAKNAANDESSDTTIFNITFDNTAPVLSNISFASTNLRKQPYKSSETLYFVNNKDDGNSATTTPPSFTIRGIATDNVGVADVTLTIGTAQITRTSTSLNEWEFANINLSSYAENATTTASVTVTDVSGHSANKEFTIKFDTTAPKAMHWADAKGKDIYFRIGNADNDKTDATHWETGDTVNTANESKNTDVGKKYSYGSWGNDSTIEIRGYFKEATEGSGLKTIHYAIFDAAPSSTQISNFVAGTLTATGSAKVIGSFEPLATPVEKNVPYNKNTNQTGNKAAKEITTNFRTQLPGFNAQNNYLVLVAEDNAGNRAADTLVVTEGTATDGTNNGTEITTGTDNTWNSQNHTTATPYYSINKDTQAPNITPPANTSFYTNGAGDNISISGTASDGLLSGIDNVTVTIEEISFEQKITSLTGTNSDTWTATVPVSNFSASTVTTGSVYTVYAKATDKAGIGNSKQISAGTIIVDKAAPTLAISTPASNSKVSSSFTLTGTVSDGTGSGINTSQGLTLYYTTNSTAGASAPTAAPASGASASNTWVAYSTAPTLSENGQEWSCSVNLASLVHDLADTNVYFSVSATDLAGTGNTGYSAPRMVTVDRKAPVYDSTQTLIGGRTVSQLAANVWFNTETLVVSGAFTDGTTGSGVESIIYQVDSNTEQTIPTTDGSFNTNISGFTANSTLKFKAKDKVGNDTDYHADRTFTIKVDTGRPTISEVNTDDFRTPKLTNKTEAQTLTFYVTDPFPTGVTAESANAATSISKISTNAGTTSAPGPVTVSVGNITLNTASNSNGSSITIAPVSGQVNKWLVTVTVGTADLDSLSGNNPVLATVSDNATNQSASTTIGAINIDDDAPEPSFTSHNNASVLNGKVALSGRITDPSSSAINAISITATASGTGASTTPMEFAWPAQTGKGTITFNASNGIWSIAEADFDTTQLYNGAASPASSNLTISITATDVANNTSSAVSITPKIDQNTDRPVAKFTNLMLKNSEYILTYGNAASMEGTVTDDDATSDAVVEKFLASSTAINSDSGWTGTESTEEPGTWIYTHASYGTTTFTPATGAYTYTPPSAADGLKIVYFYIKDNKGKEFTTAYASSTPAATDVLKRPYEQYKTSAKASNDAALQYRSDSHAPSIDSSLQVWKNASGTAAADKNGSPVQLGASCIVGGVTKKFVDVNISATDANGIQGIVIELKQGDTIKRYRSNNTVFAKDEDGNDIPATGSNYADTGTVTSTADANGVYSAHIYAIPRLTLNGTGAVFTQNSTSTVDDIKNGLVTVTITAYDKSGIYGSQNSQFVIDNTAPILKITTPATDNDTVYAIQSNRVGGTPEAADGATDVETIKYAVSTSATQPTSGWNDVGTTLSATVIFDGDEASTQDGKHSKTLRDWYKQIENKTDAQVNASDDIIDMYVHFLVTDKCGNAGWSYRRIHTIPNGDKPFIELVYPENKSDGTASSLAGTIRIYGYANVHIGTITGTYVQIDPNYTGIYNATTHVAADFSTSWETTLGTLTAGKATYNVEQIGEHDVRGIRADGTQNWNLPINGNNEFNPDGDDSRRMAIRIYTISNSGKLSEPYDQVFEVDPNAPHIGGDGSGTGDDKKYPIQLVEYTGNPTAAGFANFTNPSTYRAGMWTKGQKYLIASVYDDSGIKKLTLNENIQNVPKINLVSTAGTGATAVTTIHSGATLHTSNGGGSILVVEKTCGYAGKRNLWICIPLPTNSGSGNLEWVLEATEDSGNNNSCTETIRINYDNTPPKLGTVDHEKYNIDSDIHQSQGFYNFKGYASDAEGNNSVSGMMGVAFYFMRRATSDTTSTRVYDPMLQDSSVAVRTGTTNEGGISYSHGLYWKQKTGITRTNTNLKKLTLTAADTNIHTGGLALIGGTIYRIESVSGADVFVDSDVPENLTSADFALALVVDNLNKKESTTGRTINNAAGYGHGYYSASATADDGDLMVEDWDGTSVEGQWTAIINSANIPDGPIELHYVAFDKSQNYAVGIVGNVTDTVTTDTNNDYWDYSTLDVTDNTALKNLTGTGVNTTTKLATNFYYAYDSSKPAYISNNAPRIAGVTVGTDYNGDGDITDGSTVGGVATLNEKKSKYSGEADRYIGGTSASNIQKKATGSQLEKIFLASSSETTPMMVIKDKMSVDIEIIGGNGDLYYRYKVGTGDWNNGASAWVAGRDYTRNTNEGLTGTDAFGQSYYNTTAMPTLEFDETVIRNKTSADGTVLWTFEIWDSTEERTYFVDSQNTTLKLPLDIQVRDTTPPNTVISPLYWNSSSDNSVYKNANNKLFGHIELKSDLETGTGKLGTVYGTDDDKVSGIVTFSGYAYDNKRLAKLKWGIRDKLTGNILQAWPQQYVDYSVYTAGSGWSSPGSETLALPYYYFKVYDDVKHGAYLDGRGHKVYWELTIDTSRVQEPGKAVDSALGVGKDLYVYVWAEDSSYVDDTTTPNNKTNLNPTVKTDGTDAENISPNYKVDVLPYIKGVKTRLATKNKKNPEVYSRTAQGHYPIASDETEVILQGFNLAAGNADVNISSTIANMVTGAYAYTIPGTTITTINNMNNNNAHGDFDTTNTSYSEETKVLNMYNRTPSTVTNLTLNDDVYFDMWEFKKAASPKSGKINEPVMRINPTNNMIGFAFANGADAVSLPNGSTNSYTAWQKNYADYNGINFVYDTNGRAHSISTGLDTEPNAGYAGYMQYILSAWGKNGINNLYNWHGDATAALESVGIPNGVYVNGTALTARLIDVDRFGKPTLAVAGTNRVYVAYFDGDNNQIRFRYGTVGNTKTGRTNANGQLSDDKAAAGTIGNDTYNGGNNSYGSHTMFEAHPDYYSVLAGKTQRQSATDTQVDTGNGTSEFVALDVVAGANANADVVVIVWYDGSDLMYTYRYGKKDDDTDCSSAGVADRWSEPQVIFEGVGQYCTIKVDKNNGIHIAAYNRSGADLYYAYMPAYNQYSKLKTALVDSYSQVGKYISLDTALVLREGTIDKYNVVPYITYYGDGFNGLPKLAYLPGGINKDAAVVPNGADDDTDMFTGNWEVSLIPTSSEVNEDNMNVALWKTNAGVLTASSRPNDYTEPSITAAGTNNATWYGNGTSNIVLGYGITKNATGFIEIAQRK